MPIWRHLIGEHPDERPDDRRPWGQSWGQSNLMHSANSGTTNAKRPPPRHMGRMGEAAAGNSGLGLGHHGAQPAEGFDGLVMANSAVGQDGQDLVVFGLPGVVVLEARAWHLLAVSGQAAVQIGQRCRRRSPRFGGAAGHHQDGSQQAEASHSGTPWRWRRTASLCPP